MRRLMLNQGWPGIRRNKGLKKETLPEENHYKVVYVSFIRIFVHHLSDRMAIFRFYYYDSKI
jgi:hypothetical protein